MRNPWYRFTAFLWKRRWTAPLLILVALPEFAVRLVTHPLHAAYDLVIDFAGFARSTFEKDAR